MEKVEPRQIEEHLEHNDHHNIYQTPYRRNHDTHTHTYIYIYIYIYTTANVLMTLINLSVIVIKGFNAYYAGIMNIQKSMIL